MNPYIKTAVCCSPLLLLCGCGVLTSEHVGTIQKVLADQVANGNLTQDQFNSIMGALSGLASSDWTSAMLELLNGALTLVAGYFGVRWWRGPVMSRKGLPPTTSSKKKK